MIIPAGISEDRFCAFTGLDTEGTEISVEYFLFAAFSEYKLHGIPFTADIKIRTVLF